MACGYIIKTVFHSIIKDVFKLYASVTLYTRVRGFTLNIAFNKIIYYIGYDNPTLHYKIGDGEFEEIKLTENLERIGATHKHIFYDVTDDITLYFEGENGEIDEIAWKRAELAIASISIVQSRLSSYSGMVFQVNEDSSMQ